MATIWTQEQEGFVPTLCNARGSGSSAVEAAVVWSLGEARIVRFGDGGRQRHALICPEAEATRVNGVTPVGGMCVLCHRDEILLGSQLLYFSAEAAPRMEIFQQQETRSQRCPICRDEFQAEQQVVVCPGCARTYHQIDASKHAPEKHCWTYLPRCRFCEHPTSLSGELAWRPGTKDQPHPPRTIAQA